MTADPVPPARPPDTRDDLLAALSEEQRWIALEVLELVGELETVAPWEALRSPPSTPSAFFAVMTGLVEAVAAAPARLRRAIPDPAGVADPAQRDRLLRMASLTDSLGALVSAELEALQHRISLVSPQAVPNVDDVSRIVELACDLKGRFASALMRGAAQLVAEDRWPAVSVETVLFPETKSDHGRSRVLLQHLRELRDGLLDFQLDDSFIEDALRWKSGRRGDKFALAELLFLRGAIGKLLRWEMRRALYAGDYHEIELREGLLSRRLKRLEVLHALTWTGQYWPPTPPDPVIYQKLEALTLEIAAILDVDLLEMLLGRGPVRQLMELATVEHDPSGHREPTHQAAVEELPEPQRGVVPLLARQDLRSLVEILVGAVQKRLCLEEAEGVAASAGEDALGPLPRRKPAPAPSEEGRPPRSAPGRRPAPETGGAAAARVPPPPLRFAPDDPGSADGIDETQGAITQTREPLVRRIPYPEQLEVLRSLQSVLEDVRSPRSEGWRTVRELNELSAQRQPIPTARLKKVQPFLFDVLNCLVPLVESASGFNALPPGIGGRFIEISVSLSQTNPTDETIPLNLARLVRLIEGLGTQVRDRLAREEGSRAVTDHPTASDERTSRPQDS